MDILEELKESAAALRRKHIDIKKQVEYRDEVIRNALAQGKSWAEIQDAADVGPRIIQIARKRK